MTSEEDAMANLRDSGLLDGLAWAAPAAFEATDHLYDEDAGHDQGVVGYLNFKHFQDLMDRATSNGRFLLGEGVDGKGSDVVERGIMPDVFRSMPQLKGEAIVRSNYQQSPGWAIKGYRVLLQSYTFGQIDDIKWVQRSDAKYQVASQYFASEGTLFDDAEFGLESDPGIPYDDDFDGVTLVAAHAFNPLTKQYELYIGQSKNPEYPQASCWHWKQLLLSGGTRISANGTVEPSALPGDGASTNVEDVPVRIKTRPAEEGSGSSNG
jgi:hypothetical protein